MKHRCFVLLFAALVMPGCILFVDSSPGEGENSAPATNNGTNSNNGTAGSNNNSTDNSSSNNGTAGSNNGTAGTNNNSTSNNGTAGTNNSTAGTNNNSTTGTNNNTGGTNNNTGGTNNNTGNSNNNTGGTNNNTIDPPMCEEDAQCAGNERCSAGTCEPISCVIDLDCEGGERRYECINDVCSEPLGDCTEDRHCDGGLVCVVRECVLPEGVCDGDQACDEGLTCEDGRCVPGNCNGGNILCPETTVCIDTSCCTPDAGITPTAPTVLNLGEQHTADFGCLAERHHYRFNTPTAGLLRVTITAAPLPMETFALAADNPEWRVLSGDTTNEAILERVATGIRDNYPVVVRPNSPPPTVAEGDDLSYSIHASISCPTSTLNSPLVATPSDDNTIHFFHAENTESWARIPMRHRPRDEGWLVPGGGLRVTGVGLTHDTSSLSFLQFGAHTNDLEPLLTVPDSSTGRIAETYVISGLHRSDVFVKIPAAVHDTCEVTTVRMARIDHECFDVYDPNDSLDTAPFLPSAIASVELCGTPSHFLIDSDITYNLSSDEQTSIFRARLANRPEVFDPIGQSGALRAGPAGAVHQLRVSDEDPHGSVLFENDNHLPGNIDGTDHEDTLLTTGDTTNATFPSAQGRGADVHRFIYTHRENTPFELRVGLTSPLTNGLLHFKAIQQLEDGERVLYSERLLEADNRFHFLGGTNQTVRFEFTKLTGAREINYTLDVIHLTSTSTNPGTVSHPLHRGSQVKQLLTGETHIHSPESGGEVYLPNGLTVALELLGDKDHARNVSLDIEYTLITPAGAHVKHVLRAANESRKRLSLQIEPGKISTSDQIQGFRVVLRHLRGTLVNYRLAVASQTTNAADPPCGISSFYSHDRANEPGGHILGDGFHHVSSIAATNNPDACSQSTHMYRLKPSMTGTRRYSFNIVGLLEPDLLDWRIMYESGNVVDSASGICRSDAEHGRRLGCEFDFDPSGLNQRLFLVVSSAIEQPYTITSNGPLQSAPREHNCDPIATQRGIEPTLDEQGFLPGTFEALTASSGDDIRALCLGDHDYFRFSLGNQATGYLRMTNISFGDVALLEILDFDNTFFPVIKAVPVVDDVNEAWVSIRNESGDTKEYYARLRPLNKFFSDGSPDENRSYRINFSTTSPGCTIAGANDIANPVPLTLGIRHDQTTCLAHEGGYVWHSYTHDAMSPSLLSITLTKSSDDDIRFALTWPGLSIQTPLETHVTSSPTQVEASFWAIPGQEYWIGVFASMPSSAMPAYSITLR